MGFTVDDFSARVRELNRKHQFQVSIIFPTAIPGGTSDYNNILAESANLPGRKIDPVDVDFAGLPYKLAGKVSYSPWKVKFRIDDNLDIYKTFRAWSELIIGTQSGMAAFPAQYKSSPILYELDNNGNQITKITLGGAWLSELGDLEYDTKDRGIVNLDCTFIYDFSLFSVV